MNVKKLYFSPTGTTRRVVSEVAGRLAEACGCKAAEETDITLPSARQGQLSFSGEDLVVVGMPVYAGRVPNVLVKFLNTIRGNGALAAAVVVYGNRHYDDALVELCDILEADGFRLIAGGAFIGEHSFSRILGKSRPDKQDLTDAGDFALRIHEKLARGDADAPLTVPGNRPYRAHYKPKNKEGSPVSILKVEPKTNSDCTRCGHCANLCPMGSIDPEDITRLTGVCIKCCACVKGCPTQAKYFDDANYLWHKEELELNFTSPRRSPELYL